MPHHQSSASPARHQLSRSPLHALRAADAQLRTIVIRVRTWGLSVGKACNTDALTAVIGAAVDEGRAGRCSPLQWTAPRVHDVLSSGAPGFCAARDVAVPEGLSAAMALWLDYLAAQSAFSPGSEPVERLRTAALVSDEGPAHRRRRPAARHPANSSRL